MGFNVIIKLIKEALGIIIIVAAVILFSYLDPFGWFESKPKIQGTAILVREVKAIGELITAEYYGEALTSWPKVFAQSARDEDTLDIIRIVDGITNELTDANEKDKDEKGNVRTWNESTVWKYYKNNVRDHYDESDLYTLITKKIASKLTRRPASWNREKRAIQELFAKAGEDRMLTPNDLVAISDEHIKNRPRSEKRKDAVCIGRGIVRAGIDLSKVKETDVTIFEFSKTAYISNATVKIISVEMNPWFIPQKNVKGFEILKLKGRIDGKDIHLLKAKCKELIEKQANDRHILGEAKKNAEEALLSFFNLIRKEPLDSVHIVMDTLEELHIKFDSLQYLSPLQAIEFFNKSFLYLDSHVPGDTTMYAAEKKSLKDLIAMTRKKMITFPAENKNATSGDLKAARIAVDYYNIMALMQHFKIASATDTKKKKKLTEMAYLNQFWSDSAADKTNAFSQSILTDRVRKIEDIYKTGL
jgi:hypothetical protein